MCAMWRLDVLGTILVFIHHIDSTCQYRSWKKNRESFLGSCLVFLVILVTYGLHRKNTFTSTKWQRSRLTRILSRTWSHWTSIVQRFNNTDYWKWGRFHWHPKFRKKRFQLNHWLVHIAQSPQTTGQLPVELLWKCHHLMMGQLRGSNMRSWSMIGWILHSLKLVNENQHLRTDLSEMQQCAKDFLTEHLYEQKMKSSILRILWDSIVDVKFCLCNSFVTRERERHNTNV